MASSHGQSGSHDRNVTLSGGTSVPLLGFGTWQLRGRQAYDSVRTALDVGYRHVDTAAAYANEDHVGAAVRDSGVPRDEVFVTTKLPAENAGREQQTLARSLDLLGLDYVDLWLIHWPPGGGAAPDVWRELLTARDKGLARAVGVSNYSAAQIDALIEATGSAPEVNQIRWSPRLYDPARVEHLRSRQVVLEGYSPFKASDLTHPVLLDVADAHGVTAAQVVLRWHVDHGFVTIPKSSTPERIASNFDIWRFALSADELARLDQLSRH